MKKYTGMFGQETTAERYVVEIICQRLAKWKKIKLEYGFWNLSAKEKNDIDWKQFYKMQLIKAFQLSKTYSAEALISALSDYRCEYCCTLRDKTLAGVVHEHYKRGIIKDAETFVRESDKKSTRKKL